jgi:hypothetical protein
MQKSVRYTGIAAIIPAWLLSVSILISFVNFDVAQAQISRATALACGKELKKQCGGVPVLANNMNECLKKSQGKLSARCVAFANYVVRSCERDAVQYCPAVAAGQSNILGCLRTANRVVSPQCNAALDTAYARR